MDCHRCSTRPGKPQPSDGDAAMLFLAAHGETGGSDVVCLCTSCARTLEAMSLRVAGPRLCDRCNGHGGVYRKNLDGYSGGHNAPCPKCGGDGWMPPKSAPLFQNRGHR